MSGLAKITNTTLAEIAQKLNTFQSVLVCGHLSPDGDCVGSGLGLVHALRALGKEARYMAPDDEPLGMPYDFLPGYDSIVFPSSYTGHYECFVAVDVPHLERMKRAGDFHRAAPYTITIDHHDNPERVSDLTYCAPDSPSTTMLIWELVGCLEELSGLALRTADVATCCYCGMLTDTGSFQNQNTTRTSFLYAADMVDKGADIYGCANAMFCRRTAESFDLECRMLEKRTSPCEGFLCSALTEEDFAQTHSAYTDAESFVATLRKVEGYRVYGLFREHENTVRLSLRAKGDEDVSWVARELDGGGHRAAAGVTFHCALDEAIANTTEKMRELFAAR